MRAFQSFFILCLLFLSVTDSNAEVGEFSIPEVIPLNQEELKTLRSIVDTHPEAKTLADKVEETTLPLLGSEPRPLEVIHYEGLVNTDPRRIATVKKLNDMADAARLVRYWQVSGDIRAADTLKRYISEWTGTYKLTGNDVNENKFFPMLVAYHALRDQFASTLQEKTDGWVRRLGELHKEAVNNSTHFTNRYSKHVRLLAICGMILNRDEWIKTAHEGIKRFVKQSLYADGTSHDLKRRDTLTYHSSALRPPIQLAMIAGDKGHELYTWESPEGGSIKKSVDYVVPYAMGETTREEWTNTKIGLDKRRAEAGLEKYKPGKLYDPKNALDLMEEASYFDRDLMKVVRHLSESDAEDFPTWQTLINAAARGDE